MKSAAIILCLFIVGCAAKNQPSAADQRQRVQQEYVDRSSGALAFDLPVAEDGPTVYLWRDQRRASAFMGFEQTVTIFSYVRWDDRQTEDVRNDRFTRRAITEQYQTRWR